MPNATGAERLALAVIVALTAWRLAWLPAADLELYVDEAQYWLWGRELAAGAWSKPPLVGWLIRAANGIAGSDAPWVARLPWPLVHGGAALAVWALGRAVAGPAEGALAGVVYATLPAVAVGSILISTDSPQMLALALFLLAWARARGRSGAALAGAALAAGMWSKYAMLFAVPGLTLAALIDPRWRRPWGHAAVAAAVALALFAPNILWNLAHDLATVRHTADNADWQGAPDAGRVALFLAAQFAVAGPLTFAALLVALLARRWPPGMRGLAAITAAPLAIVAAQALQSGANANWAVGAYVPGAVLIAAVLAPRPRRAVLAVGLNAAVALALPVIGTRAQEWRRDGAPVLARYVGNAAAADAMLARARQDGARLIVASDRAVLAQLFWRAHTTAAPVTIRAVPAPGGPVPSHYDLIYPLRGDAGPALWAGETAQPPACAGAPLDLPAGTGDLGGRALATMLLAPDCLDRLRR
ncbi:ArnT family glycosyltransferase [Paracoccus luteus]|uniref:ArnT family glycosyltransferase n=1 Tax=Paracoccus luteus TaxID=2508543 RepID=UPI00106F2E68|nr:glycosyltransferase family 39 protein [Paracoccus luteus]